MKSTEFKDLKAGDVMIHISAGSGVSATVRQSIVESISDNHVIARYLLDNPLYLKLMNSKDGTYRINKPVERLPEMYLVFDEEEQAELVEEITKAKRKEYDIIKSN
jgi:heptaprenylglyceryl phosphate synthase